MKGILEEKEMDGCTFAPQLATKKKKKNQAEPRNMQKFLEDQAKYEEQRRQKLNERKEKKLEQEIQIQKAQPMINKKSKKMIEKKAGT